MNDPGRDTTCKTCRFAREIDKTWEKFRECRRRAPVPRTEDLPLFAKSGNCMQSSYVANFPLVHARGWCGEWEPIPNL